jgi:hypothetical protein
MLLACRKKGIDKSFDAFKTVVDVQLKGKHASGRQVRSC